jgi:hypothetical protein
VGKNYYEARAALMLAADQGLTATYNRFNDPEESDPAIVDLRALHAAMDASVLDACTWTDLCPLAIHEMNANGKPRWARNSRPGACAGRNPTASGN